MKFNQHNPQQLKQNKIMAKTKKTQEENLDIFQTVKKLFDLENPNEKPSFTQFKTTAKRNL